MQERNIVIRAQKKTYKLFLMKLLAMQSDTKSEPCKIRAMQNQSHAKSEPCEMEGKNIADQKITQKESGEERELQGTD